MLKEFIKTCISRLPYIKAMQDEIRLYKVDNPPGHFYSPIVSPDEIRKREQEVFSIKSNKIEGIDLHEEEQVALLQSLLANYPSIPFSDERQDGLRYYYKNDFYSYSDAIFLHLMIRHFRPKTIIEVGSGFSSAVMLDTNERFFDNAIEITFVEPNPGRLFSLFKGADKEKHKTIAGNLQETDVRTFDVLEENDILFIDSTHVSKTDSDVNRVLFEILPRLKKGVIIHFHDIFYPFEYPKNWVLNWKGFGWNEDYILKAFLMYNNQFKILMFNTFLEHFHKSWFEEHMPLCLKNRGGSIWLQKA